MTTLASAAGYQVIGLSPTAAASQQLAQQAGIKADTVAAHLVKTGQFKGPASPAVIGLHRKRLIIVDEASMLSTRQMHGLLQSLGQEDPQTRLLLVGDHKQRLLSGNPASNHPSNKRQQKCIEKKPVN